MLLKNVYLFNGQPLTSASDIRIESDRITAIAPSLAPLDGEQVIDGRGSIALPGLTDAHRHVWHAPFKGFAADQMLPEYLEQAVGGLGSRISADDLYYLNLYVVHAFRRAR